MDFQFSHLATQARQVSVLKQIWVGDWEKGQTHIFAMRENKSPCLPVGNNITMHRLSTHLLSSFRVINYVSQNLCQREISSYHSVLIPLFLFVRTRQRVNSTFEMLESLPYQSRSHNLLRKHLLCTFFVQLLSS